MRPESPETAKRIRPENYLDFRALGPQIHPQPDYVQEGSKVRIRINFSKRMSWLNSEALRLLAKTQDFDAEYIATLLEMATVKAIPEWYSGPYAGDHSEETLRAQCLDAATWAIEHYDTQKLARIRGTASKAGKAFRKVRPWDLRHKAVRGLSKAEQAKALGVSTSTVATYRRINAKQDAAQARERAWTKIPVVPAPAHEAARLARGPVTDKPSADEELRQELAAIFTGGPPPPTGTTVRAAQARRGVGVRLSPPTTVSAPADRSTRLTLRQMVESMELSKAAAHAEREPILARISSV